MKLRDAARFFDKSVAKDAYTGMTAFRCQVEPVDLFRVEGTRIKLRNMSASPDITPPLRRVILIGSQRYIMSDSSQDDWEGEALRLRFVLQGADHLVEMRTIAQVLADTPGTSAYASIDFNKYSTDERDNSDFHAQYHIFFAGSESVAENTILTTGSDAYLVRNSYRTPAGIVDALSNKLDAPVVDTATFKVVAYDPITDTNTETATTVRCVRVRWQDHFAYLSQGSADYERGDIQAFVPLSVTPKAGDTLTLADGAWRIVSTLALTDYRSLHLRRA